MKQHKQINIELINKKEAKYAWVISVMATSILFLASFALIPAFSPSNDDAYIERSLAGTSGVAVAPQPYTTTINIVLGLLISSLYRIAPFVRWWIVFQYAVIFFAVTFFGRTTIVLLRMRGVSYRRNKDKNCFLLELVIVILFELGLFAILIPRIQFTTTSSLLVSIAIFSNCIWKENEKSVQRDTLNYKIIPSVLTALGYLYRAQSTYIGFVFWGVIKYVQFKSRPKSTTKKTKKTLKLNNSFTISLLICILLACIEILAINMPNQPIKEQFNEFSTWVDYPHPSYCQDPDLYKSVGWDEPLAELVDSWFMLDNRINPDTLGELNKNVRFYGVKELLNDPYDTLLNRLDIFLKPVVFAYYTVFTTLSIISMFISKKRKDYVTSLILWIIPMILLFYLFMKGRLIERAAFAILLPAIAACTTVLVCKIQNFRLIKHENKKNYITVIIQILINLYLISLSRSGFSKAIGLLPIGLLFVALLKERNQSQNEYKHKEETALIRIASCLICILLIATPTLAAIRVYGWNSSDYADQKERLKNTEAFYKYADEHKANLYVYSGLPITVQYIWMDEWPENQTGWGGWRYSYKWFDEALDEAGLGRQLTSGDLLRSNVYFVSASEDTCKVLLQYMRNKFGNTVKMTQVDTIRNEIKIYKIDKM